MYRGSYTLISPKYGMNVLLAKSIDETPSDSEQEQVADVFLSAA